MPPMETLPTELLLPIAVSILPDEPSLAALARTSRRLYHLCNPILYEHNVRRDPRYRSAVAWAAQHGRLDTLQKALDAGAPLPRKQPTLRGVNQQGPHMMQFGREAMRVFQRFRPHPISLAAENGHEHLVRLMIDRGVSPNTKNPDGHTVLALAAIHGHASLAEYLLRVGARQGLRSFIQQRPMWLAAYQGHGDVVEVLLSASMRKTEANDPGSESESESDREPTHDELMIEALFAAVEAEQVPVVDLLVAHGMDVNVCSFGNPTTPLYVAAFRGHGEMVSRLLAHGADPNLVLWPRHGPAPLSGAVMAGREDLIRILLPGTVGWQRTRALSTAIEQHNRPLAEVLLHLGTPSHFEPEDIPSSEFAYDIWAQPLLVAVRTNDLEMAELLLDCGADVNVRCAERDDYYPREVYNRVLFWAVKGGVERMVALLLERGADMEASDKMGRPPLSYAVESGNEALVRLLLDQGANAHRAVDGTGTKLRLLAGTKESIRVRLSEAEERQLPYRSGCNPAKEA